MNLSLDQKSTHQSHSPRNISANISSVTPQNVYTFNNSLMQSHPQSSSSMFIQRPNAYQMQASSLPSMYHQLNHNMHNMLPLNAQNVSTNMSPLTHINITRFPNNVPSLSSFPQLQALPPNNILPQHVLPLINAATFHTMQRTDDLALNDQFISSQSAPQHIFTSPLSSTSATNANEREDIKVKDDEIEAITRNNPWFNDEIASIVKLHRKTARKYHRSKTNKKELKEICRKLEKKKRKLIKAAKQKYMRQLMEQTQTKIEDKKEMKHDEDCKENNEENMSGYLPYYMAQIVGEILWSHFADGKHWKIDVDDILESDDNRHETTHLLNWMKQIKDSGCQQWRHLKKGYHWKVDVYDILSS